VDGLPSRHRYPRARLGNSGTNSQTYTTYDLGLGTPPRWEIIIIM